MRFRVCLQVEAGRVDHAGHAQDLAALIHEQLEFDRLISIALEFVEQQPDTLLIITSDHEDRWLPTKWLWKGYISTNLAMNRIAKIKTSLSLLLKN